MVRSFICSDVVMPKRSKYSSVLVVQWVVVISIFLIIGSIFVFLICGDGDGVGGTSHPKISFARDFNDKYIRNSSRLVYLNTTSFKSIENYSSQLKWVTYGRNSARNHNTSKITMRFAHFVNLYVGGNKHFEDISVLSLASMEIARLWVMERLPQVVVDIFVIEGPINPNENNENNPIRPSTFLQTTNLKKSINDYPSVKSLFQSQYSKSNLQMASKLRNLPLLRDILNIMIETDQIDRYSNIIYTNIDICVVPHFYAIVFKLLKCGMKDMFINR